MEMILAKEHELKTIGVQAAAAAHSLSSPLSTIKLVAKELEKEILHLLSPLVLQADTLHTEPETSVPKMPSDQPTEKTDE